MDLLKKLWEAWVKVGQIIGDFIGRFLLTLLYFTVVAPFGLASRLFSDPLRIKGGGSPSWVSREASGSTVDDARRLA